MSVEEYVEEIGKISPISLEIVERFIREIDFYYNHPNEATNFSIVNFLKNKKVGMDFLTLVWPDNESLSPQDIFKLFLVEKWELIKLNSGQIIILNDNYKNFKEALDKFNYPKYDNNKSILTIGHYKFNFNSATKQADILKNLFRDNNPLHIWLGVDQVESIYNEPDYTEAKEQSMRWVKDAVMEINKKINQLLPNENKLIEYKQDKIRVNPLFNKGI